MLGKLRQKKVMVLSHSARVRLNASCSRPAGDSIIQTVTVVTLCRLWEELEFTDTTLLVSLFTPSHSRV